MDTPQILILLLVANFVAEFASFCVLALIITRQNKELHEWFSRFARLQEIALLPLPMPSSSEETTGVTPIPDVLPLPPVDGEKQPRPKEELAAELEEHWKTNPPNARPASVPTTSAEEKPTSTPTLSRGEKTRLALQKSADEKGISVPELMRQRTAKRRDRNTEEGEETRPEPAPAFRKWQEGDKAVVKKEVAAPAFEEEECLRVGTVVQVHSIKKLSAVVFDPTNPLRGIAEADRGIGGWVIAFRNLELIKE